jgi:hypothetical protein
MFIGMDRGTAAEGEILEEGGTIGGEGIAPEGKKEAESRLDIVRDRCAAFGCLY